MNKTELIEEIVKEAKISKDQAKVALDTVFNTISKTLKNGESAPFLGFGTFSVAVRAARTGINPRTKEKLSIAAKKVVKFKAGSDLKSL